MESSGTQSLWSLSGYAMKKVSESIPGYSYGKTDVVRSAVSTQDLENLKISAGFTKEDEHYLRLAGEVLADETKQIVDHWRRGIIANIPTLPDILVRLRETQSPNTWRTAISVLSNGFWTHACGHTIRTGLTTSRR